VTVDCQHSVSKLFIVFPLTPVSGDCDCIVKSADQLPLCAMDDVVMHLL